MEGKKDNDYTSDSIICPFGPKQLVAAGQAKKQVHSILFNLLLVFIILGIYCIVY